VKIYVATTVEALRKRERGVGSKQDETQFTKKKTKFGAFRYFTFG
jgi:hypothetical protein